MNRFVLPIAAGLSCLMPTLSPAQGLVPCAPEGGFCRLPYPTRVIYGVPGGSTARFIRRGGVPCSNEMFGDPAPGIRKHCAFVEREDLGWRGSVPREPGVFTEEAPPRPASKWEQKGFCPPGQHKKGAC
jgi:hypothetical protein